MKERGEDPEHPILPHACLWDLIEFTYHCQPNDHQGSYIDLTFSREGVVRKLRFLRPQNVELSDGRLKSSGMLILDISRRQLEGLNVRVITFERPYGVPTFWAYDVREVL